MVVKALREEIFGHRLRGLKKIHTEKLPIENTQAQLFRWKEQSGQKYGFGKVLGTFEFAT